MANIYLNRVLPLGREGILWSAQNGLTRRNLVLVNKLRGQGFGSKCRASIGTLSKGNHSFIFLNEERRDDYRILGIFLNNSYGYKVKEGVELFSTSSVGGPGNSESKFGVYELGTILEVNTYKNRKDASYWRLTANGWVEIPIQEIFKEEEEMI